MCAVCGLRRAWVRSRHKPSGRDGTLFITKFLLKNHIASTTLRAAPSFGVASPRRARAERRAAREESPPMVLRRAVGRRRTLFIGLTMFAAACASGEATQTDGDNTPRVGPVRIIEKADAPVSGTLEQDAVSYVRTYDSNLRLSDKDDFALVSSRLGADKRMHVRLQQTYDGVPIWGSDIVVHAAEGKFRGLNGTLAVHLPNLD